MTNSFFTTQQFNSNDKRNHDLVLLHAPTYSTKQHNTLKYANGPLPNTNMPTHLSSDFSSPQTQPTILLEQHQPATRINRSNQNPTTKPLPIHAHITFSSFDTPRTEKSNHNKRQTEHSFLNRYKLAVPSTQMWSLTSIVSG